MGMSVSAAGGRRGGFRKNRHYTPMGDINVTPFVDVMLVLLIVFMVTAPLLTPGVPVDLPKSKAKALTEEDTAPLEITIKKDGAIFLGEQDIPRERLINILTPMMENNPERRIFIRGDKDIDYGVVMAVIGDVNSAGFKRVALVSQKE